MSWTLPRLVGSGNARRILLTDEVLDAETAAALGIVGMVVDDDAVLAEAERLAARLADGPTVAFGRIKALLAASLDCTLSEQLVAEERAIAASAAGPEGAEGLAAFVEKRPPKFR
jgi:2-(1,2-epoxy-1,2-dihydrophenyl)acetyl-CoA isomerase